MGKGKKGPTSLQGWKEKQLAKRALRPLTAEERVLRDSILEKTNVLESVMKGEFDPDAFSEDDLYEWRTQAGSEAWAIACIHFAAQVAIIGGEPVKRFGNTCMARYEIVRATIEGRK